MKLSHLRPWASFFVLLILSNCIEEGSDPVPGADGTDGFNALVDVTTVAAGEDCSNGGIQIDVGQDTNENDQLDSEEIISTSFICHGNDGTSGGDGSAPILATTSAELPGDNCINGGTLVEMGIDTNENGELEASEIQSSYFVCNGIDGEDGSDGSDGGNGTDGTNGTDGQDGATSLVRATIEPAGTNCENGGMKIEIGLDTDDNGALDEAEIESTFYTCNGADGSDGSDGSNGADGSDGLNSMVRVDNEPDGDNCANGGLVIRVGIDSDGSGTLDTDEYIGDPQYICHGLNGGADGEDGKSPIVVSHTNVGSCANGGTELTFGYDEDGDGSLTEGVDTILETITICNGEDGADGYNTIIATTTDGVDCANGGVQFSIGMDVNSNNTLDEDEIDAFHTICNGNDGADGSNGSDGISSLIQVTTVSSGDKTCPNGGLYIEVYLDENDNGSLDTGEKVTSTQYVCNGYDGTDGTDGSDGADGLNTIIETHTDVACENGGVEFSIGLDLNSNGTLDEGEVTATHVICNGTDGSNGTNGSNGTDGISSLINVTAESAGANCTNGGFKIETGIDDDGDGTLDTGEVDNTNYICNGTNGSDGSDGSDGTSDGVYEFFFIQGMNGYEAVLDCMIDESIPDAADPASTLLTINAENPENATFKKSMLIKFDEVAKLADKLTGTYYVMEATLFLTSYIPVESSHNFDNYVGVKALVPVANDITDAATWNTMDGKNPWSTGSYTDSDADDFSDYYATADMNISQQIPFQLDRARVDEWIKGTNEGLIMEIVSDKLSTNQLTEASFYSSDYKDGDDKTNYEIYKRPTLYIKVIDQNAAGRMMRESDSQYKSRWQSMSYEEKVAPLKRR